MRLSMSMWVLIAAAGVNLAEGQVRLPAVQLPLLPTQRLTQALGQTAGNTLEQLSDARHQMIANLIHTNPRTIAADPHGNPIVRDELLAVSPSPEALQGAAMMGYRVVREQANEDLDIHLIVLAPPAGMGTAKALQRLRMTDPGGSYDYNHIYMGVGSGAWPSDEGVPAGNIVTPAAANGTGPKVGLIDSGVEVSHPAFQGVPIHSWGCQDRIVASSHGTAVASLIVARSNTAGSSFRRAPAGTELYAADVYCGEAIGGAVDALAAAFSWLAREHVAVINISLVGPDNAALAQIVRTLVARGFLLVAAVGNDGPAAPPLYPASYPHVVGVTAVDAHRRVLIEAARGSQVMFAAPGADMMAAANGSRYAAIRGTSFAAPIVAALLSEMISAPDKKAAEAAVDSLAQRAIDLGPPGRDLTYGFGLVGAERIAAAKEENGVDSRINW